VTFSPSPSRTRLNARRGVDSRDLSHITATGVSCTTAKRVARGAHKKALGLTPPPSGVRTFTWDGWKVSGDLRGNNDKYVASKCSKRVRWRF
jgi:hypothetical protein